MIHVLAPRPGGFLAALDAAPDADVVLVAHTGLDHLLTVGDVWRELPMDKRIVMRWWQVPRAEIPTGREERIDWLFGWWERIDALDRAEPAGGSLRRPASADASVRGSGALSASGLVDVDDLGRVVRRGHLVRCLGLRRRAPRRARRRPGRRRRRRAPGGRRRRRAGAGGGVGT